MGIAAIGAYLIQEYPEGVAVLLLYCVGEAFQDRAVEKARRNIESLIAIMPTKARVINGTEIEEKYPKDVIIGDFIEVRPGERVPVDGILLESSDHNSSPGEFFDTAALTGESVPRMVEYGQEVMAGMIAYDTPVHLRVVRGEQESAVMRILHLVEEATERKAPSELFIRRFARIYTPIVILFAAFTVLLPWIFSLLVPTFTYTFSEWFHRALVFLVISCPCALVISIPLSYFAGIGAASRRGILFKGSNYLDAITEIDTVVFDKTGTLTTGEFSVQDISGLTTSDLSVVCAIEETSSHPIAQAIVKALRPSSTPISSLSSVKNIAGYGIQANVGNDSWLVGSLRLLDREQITYPTGLKEVAETIVAAAKNGIYTGYILLADTPKEDARQAVTLLNERHIDTCVLSGDKQSLIDKIVDEMGISKGYGDLLPQDKVAHIEQLKAQGHSVAFVGDGINDAPVLAASDVGIAMGALGSDMAIETADIVIQTDQPSKVAKAMEIGKRTRKIVKENIIFALGVKAIVMLLGLFGIATLWEAVFADSGVALLAVLNSLRGMKGGSSSI